jgi:hypothetical protein
MLINALILINYSVTIVNTIVTTAGAKYISDPSFTAICTPPIVFEPSTNSSSLICKLGFCFSNSFHIVSSSLSGIFNTLLESISSKTFLLVSRI